MRDQSFIERERASQEGRVGRWDIKRVVISDDHQWQMDRYYAELSCQSPYMGVILLEGAARNTRAGSTSAYKVFGLKIFGVVERFRHGGGASSTGSPPVSPAACMYVYDRGEFEGCVPLVPRPCCSRWTLLAETWEIRPHVECGPAASLVSCCFIVAPNLTGDPPAPETLQNRRQLQNFRPHRSRRAESTNGTEFARPLLFLSARSAHAPEDGVRWYIELRA